MDEVLIKPGEAISESLLAGAISLMRTGTATLGFVATTLPPSGTQINVSKQGVSAAHRQFIVLASRVTRDVTVITLALLKQFSPHPDEPQPEAELRAALEQVRPLVKAVLEGR